MNISQSIIFFLSLGFLIVGAHQTFTVGFYESYWLFMLSLVFLFIYSALKKEKSKKDNSKTVKKKKNKTRNKK